MPQTCKPFKNVNCCGGTVSLLIGPLRALHSDITQSDENKKRWLETEKNRFVTRFGLWQRNLVCERVCERVCGMLCLGHLSTTTKQSAKKNTFSFLFMNFQWCRARDIRFTVLPLFVIHFWWKKNWNKWHTSTWDIRAKAQNELDLFDCTPFCSAAAATALPWLSVCCLVIIRDLFIGLIHISLSRFHGKEIRWDNRLVSTCMIAYHMSAMRMYSRSRQSIVYGHECSSLTHAHRAHTATARMGLEMALKSRYRSTHERSQTSYQRYAYIL